MSEFYIGLKSNIVVDLPISSETPYFFCYRSFCFIFIFFNHTFSTVLKILELLAQNQLIIWSSDLPEILASPIPINNQ